MWPDSWVVSFFSFILVGGMDSEVLLYVFHSKETRQTQPEIIGKS